MEEQRRSDNDPQKESASSGNRAPYSTPRLVSYGLVKDLVTGANGRMVDSSGTRSKTGCWIAEALYGVDDSRTLLLRAWLAVVYEERRPGWRLVVVYRTFGRATAGLIRRGILPRQPFQYVFDMLVDRAIANTVKALVPARP